MYSFVINLSLQIYSIVVVYVPRVHCKILIKYIGFQKCRSYVTCSQEHIEMQHLNAI